MAPGFFREEIKSSDERGLKYSSQATSNAKSLRKIAFHFRTRGLVCSDGGYPQPSLVLLLFESLFVLYRARMEKVASNFN